MYLAALDLKQVDAFHEALEELRVVHVYGILNYGGQCGSQMHSKLRSV